MRQRSGWPTTIPHSGDRFDPFDIQALRMVCRVLDEWKIQGHMHMPLNLWLGMFPATVKSPPTLTYFDLKASVFLPSKVPPPRGQGLSTWLRERHEAVLKGRSPRHDLYDEAKDLIAYYRIDRDAILGTAEHPSFRRDHYANWPYLAAAVCFVVEMAKETSDAVYVVRKRVERSLNEDFRKDPHMFAVSRFGREG